MATREDRGSGKKKGLLYSQVLQTGGTVSHAGPPGGTWTEDRNEGRGWATNFSRVFAGKIRQDRLNSLGLASLNNFGRL